MCEELCKPPTINPNKFDFLQIAHDERFKVDSTLLQFLTDRFN